MNELNICIITGSNRAESGSSKVADYVAQAVGEYGADSCTVLDAGEMNLPMFGQKCCDEDGCQNQIEQKQDTEFLQNTLSQTHALVIIAPEWNGTIPPALQNILMYLDRSMVGHKPVLLVGVSAGIGGSYPIAQLRSFGFKNNRALIIPDHVIVRNLNDDFDESDHPIGPRIKESVQELAVYAKHMNHVRDELTFDYERYKNGM